MSDWKVTAGTFLAAMQRTCAEEAARRYGTWQWRACVDSGFWRCPPRYAFDPQCRAGDRCDAITWIPLSLQPHTIPDDECIAQDAQP